MYVTSAWSLVYALDAVTGPERWVYDPKVDRAVGAKACCDVVNRGVAVYDGKVFVGVIDGRLVALDAKTGSVVWETVTVDQSLPYTITGAPRAANGLVYIGNGGAEYGVRGYVSAYDAAPAGSRWRFYTVPGDPSKGPDNAASDPVMAKAAATWNGQWWTLGGGGTVWDAIVYDADFNQLIVGVGNGSPWNQQIRSPGGGDNLFLSSIVALDAATGAYKWHYQTTPGDTWDYTATQPIVLAELTIDGKPRKVAMQAPKNGFFYVVDRENGQLISARAVSAHVAGERHTGWTADQLGVRRRPTTGRPLENPEARYRGAAALVRPGPSGAHNWHPMAFSPQTGPGLSAGAGACPSDTPTTPNRSRGPDSTISASPSSRSPTTRPCGPPSRAPRRGCCSRGTRSRSARCGVRTDAAPGTAGRWPPPAGSSFRAPATASSWRSMPGPERRSGPRTTRPRRSPVRSATRLAASSTSPWSAATAAPSS